MFKIIFQMMLITFIASGHAGAVDVKLIWTVKETTTHLDGYRIYKRAENQTYDYEQPAWTGTDTECLLTGLSEDTTYFFVIRTYRDNEESPNSNEVCTYIPVLSSPQDGAVGVSVTPILETLVQSDPAYETIHAASQWQIATVSDFAADFLVLDLITNSDLYTFATEEGTLENDMTYYWRVRHYDPVKSQSRWSEVFSFSTDADRKSAGSGSGSGCFVSTLGTR